MTEQITRNGKPVGLGLTETVAAPLPIPPSPWIVAMTTSVVGAAASWAIGEIAEYAYKRRRR